MIILMVRETSSIIFFNLVRGAEDMGVVLLEATYPRQPGECPRKLIAMENTKVGHTQGELTPGTGTVVKHQAR